MSISHDTQIDRGKKLKKEDKNKIGLPYCSKDQISEFKTNTTSIPYHIVGIITKSPTHTKITHHIS